LVKPEQMTGSYELCMLIDGFGSAIPRVRHSAGPPMRSHSCRTFALRERRKHYINLTPTLSLTLTLKKIYLTMHDHA